MSAFRLPRRLPFVSLRTCTFSTLFRKSYASGMLLRLPSSLTYAETFKERGYRLRLVVLLGPRRIFYNLPPLNNEGAIFL
jgi:hypothetical protein